MSLVNLDPSHALLKRRQLVSLGMGASALSLLASPARGLAADTDSPPGKNLLTFDFTRPEDNLLAWVKLMSTLDGTQTCSYYKGDVVAVTNPNQKNKPLFGYEGFGMTRVTLQPDGRYQKLHREISYYTDLATGEILEHWDNVLTGERVKVYPTNNDPVNSYYAKSFKQVMGSKGKQEVVEFPFILPWSIIDDRLIVTFNVHTRWRSPFSKERWPREYIGDWFKTSEMFQIHGRMSELRDPSLAKAPATSAWFKEGPYLPWMLMDNAPGRLVYNTRIFRLKSPEKIPGHILDYTEKHYPRFLEAPSEWTEPNMTTLETWVEQMEPAKSSGKS